MTDSIPVAETVEIIFGHGDVAIAAVRVRCPYCSRLHVHLWPSTSNNLFVPPCRDDSLYRIDPLEGTDP